MCLACCSRTVVYMLQCRCMAHKGMMPVHACGRPRSYDIVMHQSQAPNARLHTSVCAGASLAAAHSGKDGAHEGCGHSLIAHESRRWSDGHRNSVAAAKAVGVHIGPPVSRQEQQQQAQQQAQQEGRRLLQSSNGTLPIRIWVEFQGLSSLTSTQQTQLRDTVNIALGVLQKYLRVSHARVLLDHWHSPLLWQLLHEHGLALPCAG